MNIDTVFKQPIAKTGKLLISACVLYKDEDVEYTMVFTHDKLKPFMTFYGYLYLKIGASYVFSYVTDGYKRVLCSAKLIDEGT